MAELPDDSDLVLTGIDSSSMPMLSSEMTIIKAPQAVITLVGPGGRVHEVAAKSGIVGIDSKSPTLTKVGPSVVVLPVEGGGRGPIINYGEAVTTTTLLVYLSQALDSDQFTSAYNAIITALRTDITQLQEDLGANEDGITDHASDISDLQSLTAIHTNAISTNADDIDEVEIGLVNIANTVADNNVDLAVVKADLATMDLAVVDNTDAIILLNAALGGAITYANIASEGVAEDGDTITIPGTWSNPPKVTLFLKSGSTFVAANVANDQELIIGHGGVTMTATPDEYQFDVAAFLLIKSAPIFTSLAWSSDIVTAGEPSGSYDTTAESSVGGTAVSTSIRIKGEIRLKNEDTPNVSGTMYLQVLLNSGAWQVVDYFYNLFTTTDTSWTTKEVDQVIVLPAAMHTYKFRGLLVSTLAETATNILTGQVYVASVEESGSGTEIANDHIVRWSAKI